MSYISASNQVLIFISILASGVVKITAGKDDKQKIFFIHKKLVEERAPIFFKKFSSHFKGGTTDLIALPDESGEVFEVFSEFLYSDVGSSDLGRLNRVFSCDQSEIRWEIMETVVFAGKYCLNNLHDEVMTSWCMLENLILPLDELKKITAYLVRNSSKRCKARILIARVWASEILHHPEYDYFNGTKLDSFINDSSFTVQVINEMSRQAHQEPLDGTLEGHPVCDYHLHGKTDLCFDSHLEWHIHPSQSADTKAADANASAPKPAKKRKRA